MAETTLLENIGIEWLVMARPGAESPIFLVDNVQSIIQTVLHPFHKEALGPG